MIVKRIPAGIYAANCYILCDEATKETAVIDPGGDYDDLLKAIKDLGAEVKYVLLTHGHTDHTGAVKDFVSEFNVPVYVNSKDAELMLRSEYLFGSFEDDKKFITAADKDVITLGGTSIYCIETPGHTPGGMCYKLDDMIFTGDTLFLSSIGRTDFPGGDYDTLISSIKNNLLIYDDSTVIYPGHGPSSTIGFERKRNSFLQ